LPRLISFFFLLSQCFPSLIVPSTPDRTCRNRAFHLLNVLIPLRIQTEKKPRVHCQSHLPYSFPLLNALLMFSFVCHLAPPSTIPFCRRVFSVPYLPFLPPLAIPDFSSSSFFQALDSSPLSMWSLSIGLLNPIPVFHLSIFLLFPLAPDNFSSFEIPSVNNFFSFYRPGLLYFLSFFAAKPLTFPE